jgi:hypothetical protein
MNVCNLYLYNSTGEYKVSRLLIGLEFSYMSLYSPRGENISSESTFHCFSLLVARKLVQNFVFFSVSLIFTCVIIVKQLFSSSSVNIVEYLPRLRLYELSLCERISKQAFCKSNLLATSTDVPRIPLGRIGQPFV